MNKKTYCKSCKLRTADGRSSLYTGRTDIQPCRLGFQTPQSFPAAVRLVQNNGFASICGQNPFREQCRDLIVRNVR